MLLGDIKVFRERGDKCGAEVLGSSCIACLAHLAILYEVVGRTDPVARPEMYNLCDSALQRLGTLTSELRFDEYTYLDLLLGVRPSSRCFPMVTSGGKARPATRPPSASTGPARIGRPIADASRPIRTRASPRR